MQKKLFGIAVAGAVSQLIVASAALATGAAATGSTVADSVHCTGINSCKGTSDCKTAENACKGKNACKGHGFVATSKADCAKKGGKVQEVPKAAK